MQRRFPLFLPVLIAVPIISIAVFIILFILLQNDPTKIDFLKNALSGQEDKAFSYLSEELQAVVKTRCPKSEVTGCMNDLISPDWGHLKEIHFAYGVTNSESSNAELYHTFWSGLSSPVSIVLITTQEHGRTVINGWSGFVISEGEDADSRLMRGDRHDNELLPP